MKLDLGSFFLLPGANKGPIEALLDFINSWTRLGLEETSICSVALDNLQDRLGARPACVLKFGETEVERISERGMVDGLLKDASIDRNPLMKKLAGGNQKEFFSWPAGEFHPEWGKRYQGFLCVPISANKRTWGALFLGASKKEAQSEKFFKPIQTLGSLIGVAIGHSVEVHKNLDKERTLRAEVESTTRELAQTNERLIERVRELKTLSKELERRVEELTHANKAKDEFLSIVSHELRTPLTSINGFLAVLLDGEAGDLTDAQKKFLSIAKQSANRLNALISDLLDISRIESGRMNLDFHQCSLANLLESSLEGLEKSAKAKSIEVKKEFSSALPDIYGDEHRLRQVIDNILSNAIKFTPINGQVTVSSADMGDGIQIAIQDNGPGISEEERKRIFDMFYQVDASSRRSAGGAGLGLAIANGIISMHGGRLWVDSEIGKGAKFSFIIPRNMSKRAA